MSRAYTREQIRLLEKLNRADAGHLNRLPVLVVPEAWNLSDLTYSPLPQTYAAAQGHAKFLVVDLPGQVFGAYEAGRLVRWGPVSSGRADAPTPSGLFSLNWKSKARYSTRDPEWYMPWYFNFVNRRGLALHAYPLTGRPVSHSCIRLLERDALWLYTWGVTWTLAPDGVTVLRPGTPLLIAGQYQYGQPPPWRKPDWLSHPVDLPSDLPAAAFAVQGEDRGKRP